jgi:hypothetical protein
MDSTIESSLEPLLESTGEHVDIRVWEGAKYKSRVRGLFITENDDDSRKHFLTIGYGNVKTVHSNRYWFLLPSAQDIKTIEQAWTGSQEIKDIQDLSPQRIPVSLYAQYRKDDDGAPVRELTYLALTESAMSNSWYGKQILEGSELIASAEELELKLREAWASSHENYFQRYASGETSVLRVTASGFDRLSDRVVLGFYSDRQTKPYAWKLDSIIKSTCENPRSVLSKVYATCSRYTKAFHSLTVEPHCILSPTQDCVFIHTNAMSSGICVYITNAASEEVNSTWIIRHLVQMVVVLWGCSNWTDTKASFHPASKPDVDSKILLWIVSDPQWDLYIAIKPTLRMPGINRVHEHLASFRKVLLRHKCQKTGVRGMSVFKGNGYRNVQRDIQNACKECDFEWLEQRRFDPRHPPGPEFDFCEEDYMPG